MRVPPQPENLTSTTLSDLRRSYHWKFPGGEFDFSVTRHNIFIRLEPVGGKKREKHDYIRIPHNRIGTVLLYIPDWVSERVEIAEFMQEVYDDYVYDHPREETD